MAKPYFEALDALYRRVLLRPIDPSGYESYSALLHSGEKTLEEIAAILRSSKEFATHQQSRERARRFRSEGHERVRNWGTITQVAVDTDGRSELVPNTPSVPDHGRTNNSQTNNIDSLSVKIVLLEGDAERAAHVHNNLAPDLVGQGAASVETVPAIDGSGPEGKTEIRAQVGSEARGDRTVISSFMERKLACALSHARAWDAAGDRVALVLEDDAVVAADLVAKIAAIVDFIEEQYSTWDMVYLYSPCLYSHPPDTVAVPYGEDHEGHHGNVGYLMSPEGSSTLSSLVRERIAGLDSTELAMSPAERHFALDHSIMQWARQGELRVFWATEALVETIGQIGPHLHADDLPSTIFPQAAQRTGKSSER